MSVCIVLMCDVEDVLGTCGAWLYTGTADAVQARRSAELSGWTHRDGKDRCRLHSEARGDRPAVFGAADA